MSQHIITISFNAGPVRLIVFFALMAILLAVNVTMAIIWILIIRIAFHVQAIALLVTEDSQTSAQVVAKDTIYQLN